MKTVRTIFNYTSLNRLLPSKTLTFFLLLFVVLSAFLLNAGKVSACMSSWGNASGTLSSCTDYTGVYLPGEEMIFTDKMKDTANKNVAAYIYFPDPVPYVYSTGVVPGYIASCTNPTSCTATATLNAPTTPGTYWVAFRACGTFEALGYQCHYTGVPIYVVDRGGITVDSNISAASWTITGPATITGSGTSQYYYPQPTGIYTITWGAVAGYTKPAPQSLTLKIGTLRNQDWISFRGTYTLPPPPPAPTLTLSAAPNPAAYNAASTLSWTTSNATSCWAVNGWTGWKTNTGGSASTGPLTAAKTYSLVCWNSVGVSSEIKTVTVNVNAAPLATLTLSTSPNPVAYNAASTLSWTTTNATSCWASNGWTGWKTNTGGSESTGPLTAAKTYSLQCWNSANVSTGVKTVTVNVNAAPLATLTLSVSPNPAAYNAASTLSWTTTNATSCWATNGWTGWKTNTGGSESTGPLTAAKTYSLQCWNSAGVSSEIKTVTVNLSCTPNCDEAGSHCVGIPYSGNCGQTCTGTLPESCGSWGSCSKSCGGGTQTRTCACPSENQTRACAAQPCPPGYKEVAPW